MLQFRHTKINGLYLAVPEKKCDERGHFARVWCSEQAKRSGLSTEIKQCNISHNTKRGTIRGMHFQSHPFEEDKIVQCVKGFIYDVILDLRATEPTYNQWCSFELSADNRNVLYVPKGCAHGFQTLEDNSDVLYLMLNEYSPDHSFGVRYDSPLYAIDFPIKQNITISQRDLSFPVSK